MSQDLSTRVTQALTTPKQAAPQHSTAAMSSDEVIALAQVGYEPVSVISSSAVARLGSYAQWSLHPTRNYEVPTLTSLLNGARSKTILDLQHRCEELGGHGVVGARINLEGVEQEGVATFVATGTAVRRIDSASPDKRQPHYRTGLWGKLRHQSSDMAFTSTLSGQDFHLLLRAGGFPVGFVVGTSAFHFGWRTTTKWVRSQGRCVELGTLTQSLYGAREQAVARLQRAAQDLHAQGVIDTNIIERSDVWGQHVIEFVAYGTAIDWDPGSGSINDIGTNVMLNDSDSRGPVSVLDKLRPGTSDNR